MVKCRASFVGCPVPLSAARSAAIGGPRPRPPARAARAPPALVAAAAPIVSHHLGAQCVALAPGAGTRAGPAAAAAVPRSAATSTGAARALTAALFARNGRTAFVSAMKAMRAASSGRLPPLPIGCLGDSGHRGSSSSSRNRWQSRSGGRSRRLFARRRPARRWRRRGALLCESQTQRRRD